MKPEASLTPIDVRLLEALDRTRNVVHASRALGIGRDRAVYRLRRLSRLYGPVTTGERGGTGGGGTRLTPTGQRLLARSRGSRPGANRWTGTYRRGPPPRVEVAPGRSIEVAFRAVDRAPVTVEVDPEAFVVATHPVTLSARNVLLVTVGSVRPRTDGTVVLTASWFGRAVRVALTVGSVARLGLRAGRPAYLYAKATAVRRISP